MFRTANYRGTGSCYLKSGLLTFLASTRLCKVIDKELLHEFCCFNSQMMKRQHLCAERALFLLIHVKLYKITSQTVEQLNTKYKVVKNTVQIVWVNQQT